MQYKVQTRNITKARGQYRGEDHSLGQASMSLSSCANLNQKCFTEPFQEEMQNASAGMVSHSTMGLAPPFYLQKMAQKTITNHFLRAFWSQSQAKGLNP